MKSLPLVSALAFALPIPAVANVAMEAQQAGWYEAVSPSASSSPGTHRPLFIVKYVLRRPASGMPQIVMDDTAAQIVPPGKDVPFGMLGAMHRDPNTEVCSGWGCQRKP